MSKDFSQVIRAKLTCDKLFNVGDIKVRNHCHITGKYRGFPYWNWNINLKLI